MSAAVRLSCLLVFLALPARSEPAMTLEALLEPAWKTVTRPDGASKRGPGVMWNFRVAPPLPGQWPMTAQGTVVRWVYAAGIDLDLRDGERVAAPWARIDVKPDGSMALTVLAKQLEPLGTQGVRPLTKDEAAVTRAVFESEPALKANDVKALQPSWAAWLRNNGVIAARLKAQHEAFFAAVTAQAR